MKSPSIQRLIVMYVYMALLPCKSLHQVLLDIWRFVHLLDKGLLMYVTLLLHVNVIEASGQLEQYISQKMQLLFCPK